MVKVVKNSVIIILFFSSAFYLGYIYGNTMGYEEGNNFGKLQSVKSIDDIKNELRQYERDNINSYLEGKLGVYQKKEGPLLNKKFVYYIEGEITNSAILANVKDIKIRVDFVSKTDKVIDSKEVIIYEFINKGSTKNFKEKITVPPNYSSFKWSILSVDFY